MNKMSDIKFNKKLWIAVLLILVSITIPVLIEKFYYSYSPFSIDRWMIFSIILLFLSMHFVFKPKKIWDFMYKKRFLIGLLLFIFIVANGYNNSNMSIYNNAIPGEIENHTENPILGKTRVIRGDEWAVSSPLMLSQDLPINNFGEVNHSMMAKDTNISFYSRMPYRGFTVITSPSYLGFFFLPLENAFSFHSFFWLFVLFFATFELLMIITKKKKMLSFLGSLMVTFAPGVQWWDSYNIIASGEVAVVFFYYFLSTPSIKRKILYSLGIGFAGSCYIMTIYPAWMVTYGYFFLVIVIWMIYIHYKKVRLKDFVLLFSIAIPTMCLLLIPTIINAQEVIELISNTAYPGARISVGGSGWNNMFSYISNLFTPFKEAANASEMAQFFCLFPMPTLLGVWYVIKNKKKDVLLIGLLIVSIFLCIWTIVPIPEIVAKITMLSMSTTARSNITLGFVNVILIILLISDYNCGTKKITLKELFITSIISILLVTYSLYNVHNIYPDYMSVAKLCFSAIAIAIPIFLLLLNRQQLNKVLIVYLASVNVLIGATVHPINKGLSFLYEKPISKEIQKISKKDPYAKWMAISTPYYLQNYATANGARMINSTNYFPNFDLWYQIDNEKKYEDIYNRYAHLTVNLTKDKSNISLIYADHIQLDLNIDEIGKFDVSYLLTTLDLTNLISDDFHLEEIYLEYGMRIYKIVK